MINLCRIYLLAAVVFIPVIGGCAASSTPDDSPSKYVETPDATYSGLTGQKCAVMVWADWRTQNEYSQIQLDAARSLQYKLEQRLGVAKESKDKPKAEGSGAQFLSPASLVRYQREHPELNTMSAADVALRLSGERVTRLVYVEFEEFSAQSADAIMVLKGNAKATLRVVEVVGGKSTVVFQEANIVAHYPPNAPEGVVPSDKHTVRTIYEGTVDLLTSKLAVRFDEKQ